MLVDGDEFPFVGIDTVIIGVYHDIPLAMRLSDSLLLLKEGQLCAFGEKKELLEKGLLEKTYDFDVISYLKEMRF